MEVGQQYAHLRAPPQLLTWTMAGKNGFSITASISMIAGPILKIEDVLQTITGFNMDDGRKNVFSITVSMLQIMGPIFTFKNGRKNKNT
jgi:hypothetical protein